MMDWLREYNLADIIHFVEALEKTREQYYPDEIDMLKDAVSITFLLTGLRIYTGKCKAQVPTEGRALRGPRALDSPV